MEFKDKVVLITGGASGIGKASAVAFAAQGANVIVSDYNAEGGKTTVENIKKAGGQASFISCDVGDADQVQHLMDRIKSDFERLDIAINNAGIPGASARTHEYPLDDWDKVMSINASGVFYGMKKRAGRSLETLSSTHKQLQ